MDTLVKHIKVPFNFGLGCLVFGIWSDLVRIEQRNLKLLFEGCGDLVKDILCEIVKVQFSVLCFKC